MKGTWVFAGWGSWVARFRWPVLAVALVAVVGAGVWRLGVFGQLPEGLLVLSLGLILLPAMFRQLGNAARIDETAVRPLPEATFSTPDESTAHEPIVDAEIVDEDLPDPDTWATPDAIDVEQIPDDDSACSTWDAKLPGHAQGWFSAPPETLVPQPAAWEGQTPPRHPATLGDRPLHSRPIVALPEPPSMTDPEDHPHATSEPSPTAPTPTPRLRPFVPAALAHVPAPPAAVPAPPVPDVPVPVPVPVGQFRRPVRRPADLADHLRESRPADLSDYTARRTPRMRRPAEEPRPAGRRPATLADHLSARGPAEETTHNLADHLSARGPADETTHDLRDHLSARGPADETTDNLADHLSARGPADETTHNLRDHATRVGPPNGAARHPGNAAERDARAM